MVKDESFNLTLINDPSQEELHSKSDNYDLILIGFKMSVTNPFNLYNKVNKKSQKIEHILKQLRYVL